MLFDNHKRWGRFTFLDLLEENHVSFGFDGANLEFPNEQAAARAASIWHCLTGSRSIGVQPQKEHSNA